MTRNTLHAFGLVTDEHDPVTGHAPPLGFSGWEGVVAGFRRWRAQAPFMLDNAIAWREEQLERGPPPGREDDWPRMQQELWAALELANAVRLGVL